MFDTMKNLGQISSLLANAGKMKEKVQQMQEELGRREITADAGSGAVKATVNGKLELLKLQINPSIFDSRDNAMLEDVIVAAVRSAQAQAAAMMQHELQKAMAGLGLPPGLLP